MIRFLHLFLLSLFVYLNAISAQNSGSNGVATPPALPPDDEASPPASPPGVEALLPDGEVSALRNLLKYLRNENAAGLVNISFCSHSSNQDLGTITVYCNCSTNVCHIQKIYGESSPDLSSSSSSSSGLAPPDVTGLKFLKSLTLKAMGLQSSTLDCLGNLTALQYLDLSYNQMGGNIPTNIDKLTSLQILYLSNNQLSGQIPINIGSLGSLLLLDFSSNQLRGSIPAGIGNLTSLGYLDLSYNQLTGKIPTTIGRLRSLDRLFLSYNLLEGFIPDLKNLTKLRTLSLQVNRLNGPIPDALGKQISKLQHIRLEENQLNGSLKPELGNLPQLEYFDVGSNNLTREIPKTMFDELSSLWYFGVYGNSLSGEIPRDIAKSTSLQYLDLIGNNFNGPLPDRIFKMQNLTVLAISDLVSSPATIPEDANLTRIRALTLRNCNLFGKIPDWIWNYSKNSLSYLDLSFNDHLEKNIPNTWTQHLNAIAWGSNALGKKSFQYPSSEGILGATPNRIDNEEALYEAPPCSKDRTSLFINCGGGELNLNGTRYESDNDTVHLYQSKAQANDSWAYSCRGLSDSDEYVKNLSCAVGFSDTTLYATARVCPVSLAYYGFCFRKGTYDVTLHFAEIEYVKEEDYSSLRNRIFDIRIQENITKDYDIVKEATGPAKDVSITQTIDITNHTLEIQLYWAGKGTLVDYNGRNGVLISAISVTPVAKPPILNSLQIAFITIACVVLLGIIILALAWQQGWIGDKELYEKRIDIRGKKFTVKQLAKATHNFSRKKEIGSGGFGAVYEAQLAGQVIAVKKLSPRSKQGILEFRRELYSLKSLRHPNFVELLDGYSGHGFHLLIYEYMENKSLADVLFDPNSKQKLNWEVRYNICKDIAIGLKYLHEESHLNVIHGDIKASNILLDGGLKAKISDFGLAKIYIEDDQATVVKVGGTTGYMAPEYASQGVLSHKIDVYSFGVLLLEIVSGRKNIEYKPSEESKFLLDNAYVLHKKGKSMNLVDEDLRDDLTEQESHEAKSVLLLAMMCVSLSPSLRPTMSEVVSVLEGEKTIEQVSDEYATASTSRSTGSTTERLDRRNWSSTDYTPSSTDISSVATTTYFVIKDKDGKNDQSQGFSLEISLDIKKEQQQQQQQQDA